MECAFLVNAPGNEYYQSIDFSVSLYVILSIVPVGEYYQVPPEMGVFSYLIKVLV